jgi:phosphatidylserine/phosphatidylglycerophosphate/cardiolipin synthase-like enzyme
MDELLSAATELVALVSPPKIQAIADRVRGSTPIECTRSLNLLVTTSEARAALDRMTSSWAQSAVSGNVLSGILIGASHARRQLQSENTVDLVWTGPTTPYVATRRTEQVLLDLIRHAQTDVFLVSFVAYDVSTVVDALNAASARGVEIRFLLEASSSHGGSLSIDPVNTIRNCIPSAALYVWTERPEPFTNGRVHAKVAVADGKTAFLTSANLTGHALEKNMEAGVVVSGGQVPSNLRAHLQALIDTKIIRQT